MCHALKRSTRNTWVWKLYRSFPRMNLCCSALRLGGTNIALQDATKETYGVPLAHGGIIPGFEVEDADAIYQQWKAKSIEIVGEVTDMGAGRTFTAKDPEGHYIQVFHLYPQGREMQKQMGM